MIFVKDLAGSNGPLLCGKQTTFEGGFRVLTISWWSQGGVRYSYRAIISSLIDVDLSLNYTQDEKKSLLLWAALYLRFRVKEMPWPYPSAAHTLS